MQAVILLLGETMCLVIVGIIWPPTHCSPLKGSVPALEILELSNGWYKIKAHLDPVLVRVLKRGALRVGFKLAISGALTEAPAAGQPKAQQMGQKRTTAKGPSDKGPEEEEVRLYLEGNRTSRAQWAEALGSSQGQTHLLAQTLITEGAAKLRHDLVNWLV
jgi:breast cancer 2 susceptibility protein